MWFAYRITEKQKAGKAQNIKEKQLQNSRSTVYFQVMGRQPDGFGLMEAGYSVGLAIGILVFFNHIAVKKLNTDPTPLEVEMRLYEENICKTLIDQAGRKEKEIDVD